MQQLSVTVSLEKWFERRSVFLLAESPSTPRSHPPYPLPSSLPPSPRPPPSPGWTTGHRSAASVRLWCSELQRGSEIAKPRIASIFTSSFFRTGVLSSKMKAAACRIQSSQSEVEPLSGISANWGVSMKKRLSDQSLVSTDSTLLSESPLILHGSAVFPINSFSYWNKVIKITGNQTTGGRTRAESGARLSARQLAAGCRRCFRAEQSAFVPFVISSPGRVD